MNLFNYKKNNRMCDNSDVVDYIGYSGGIILSVCLIPQVYKIIKTKHV